MNRRIGAGAASGRRVTALALAWLLTLQAVVPAVTLAATAGRGEGAVEGEPPGTPPGPVQAQSDSSPEGAVTSEVYSQVSLPLLVSLEPYAGPVGTVITIHGRGFGTTPGSVSFFVPDRERQISVPAVSWSDTAVTAELPATIGGYPLEPGRAVQVSVVTADGQWAQTPNGESHLEFTVEPAPLAVSSITPSSGPSCGGTKVTILGGGFTVATDVYFGSNRAEDFIVESDGEITVSAPPGSGTVHVTVVTPEGTSAATDADLFTYQAEAPEAWWTVQDAGTCATIMDVHFLDESRGWAVALDWTAERRTSSILATADGGRTWGARFSESGIQLYDVHFADAGHGWAVGQREDGEAGVILTTSDGGLTWTAQVLANTERIQAVTAVDANRAWAVGVWTWGRGIILATTDGGQTWTPRWTGPDGGQLNHLESVSFLPDGLHGWAAGGIMLATTDGGQTWATQNSGTTQSFEHVTFVDELHGWAAASDGSVLATTDGGDTWRTQPTGVDGHVVEIQFLDTLRGWAVGSLPAGDAVVLATTDGGATWALVPTGVSYRLRGLSFVDGDTGWVVGDGGTILRYTASGEETGAPVVTAVAPAGGPTAGGTAVTITGSGFTGATEVSFGGVPAQSFEVESDARITAVTPPHAPGAVDVVVTGPGGRDTVTGGFTYRAPFIDAVSPSSGTPLGGTTVTITGTYLTGATGVFFGGVPAQSFEVESDTRITAVTPPHADGVPGAVDVTVTAPESSGTKARAFTYRGPVIRSLWPLNGPSNGEVAVYVFGTGFDDATTVWFGDAQAQVVLRALTPDGLQYIEVAPPPGTGPVDVTVRNADGVSTLPEGFTYWTYPLLEYVDGRDGCIEAGGCEVTVRGQNFTPDTKVLFGSREATVRSRSSQEMVVVVPPGEGVVEVTAVSAGGRSPVSLPYSYTPPPCKIYEDLCTYQARAHSGASSRTPNDPWGGGWSDYDGDPPPGEGFWARRPVKTSASASSGGGNAWATGAGDPYRLAVEGWGFAHGTETSSSARGSVMSANTWQIEPQPTEPITVYLVLKVRQDSTISAPVGRRSGKASSRVRVVVRLGLTEAASPLVDITGVDESRSISIEVRGPDGSVVDRVPAIQRRIHGWVSLWCSGCREVPFDGPIGDLVVPIVVHPTLYRNVRVELSAEVDVSARTQGDATFSAEAKVWVDPVLISGTPGYRLVPAAPPAEAAAPVLLTVDPASGTAGSRLTLTGGGFGTVAGSVYLTDSDGEARLLPVDPGDWSDGSVSVTLPNDLEPGTVNLAVDSPAGGRSNDLPFTVVVDDGTPPPVVEGLSVHAGRAGDQLTITGRGFSGATAVRFGTVPASSFQVHSDGKITATVPPGSGTVHVTVRTPRGPSAPTAADLFTYAAQVTQEVDAGGATLITPDGSVALEVPVGALDARRAVTLSQVAEHQLREPLPAGAILLGWAARVDFGAGPALRQPATLTLAYNEGLVPEGYAVAIYRHGSWIALPTTLGDGLATAAITASSDYAVLAVPPAGSPGGSEGSGGSGGRDRAARDEERFMLDGGSQQLSAFGGALELDVPAGAFPAGTVLVVRRLAEPVRAAAGGLLPASPAYELETGGVAPSLPVTLRIRYDAAAPSGRDPRKLGIYRQDGRDAAGWSYAGGVVDPAAGAVEAPLTGFSRYAVLAYDRSFTDLAGHWSRKDVEVLAARHLVRGVDDRRFEPDRPVTRAELAKLLVEMLARDPRRGVSVTAPPQPAFADVTPGAWHYAYVETAARHGIVQGAEGRFRPDDPVTREEMAAMLVRALGLEDQAAAAAGEALPYEDGAQVAEWARGFVGLARQRGLMRGMTETAFGPREGATRAQAAAVVLRAMERQGMIQALERVSGTLRVSEVEGRHFELETGAGGHATRYVLVPDGGPGGEVARRLEASVGRPVTVTGLREVGPNAYMRGPVLRVLSAGGSQ